jgi:hypothetical protein
MTHPDDMTEESIDREIEALRAKVQVEKAQWNRRRTWDEITSSNIRVKVLYETIAALWLCKKNLGRTAS